MNDKYKILTIAYFEKLRSFCQDIFSKHGKNTIIIALVFFFIGGIASYLLFAMPLQAEISRLQKQVEQYQAIIDSNPADEMISDEVRTETQIQYVPKEIIHYIDASGHDQTALEKTDVQMKVSPPDVYVKYNGTSYKMAGISGETQKFQNGKVVGEVTTNSTLDVSSIVNKEVERELKDHQPHFNYGGYVTNRGLLGSLGYENNYKEAGIIFKITNPEDFYGIGYKYHF